MALVTRTLAPPDLGVPVGVVRQAKSIRALCAAFVLLDANDTLPAIGSADLPPNYPSAMLPLGKGDTCVLKGTGKEVVFDGKAWRHPATIVGIDVFGFGFGLGGGRFPPEVQKRILYFLLHSTEGPIAPFSAHDASGPPGWATRFGCASKSCWGIMEQHLRRHYRVALYVSLRVPRGGFVTEPLSLVWVCLTQVKKDKDLRDPSATKMCTHCRLCTGGRRYDGQGRTCDQCVKRDMESGAFQFHFFPGAEGVLRLFRAMRSEGLVGSGLGPACVRTTGCVGAARNKFGGHHTTSVASVLQFVQGYFQGKGKWDDDDDDKAKAAFKFVRDHAAHCARPWVFQ